jgi:5-formyltetrahydrofolate cyclo-ligase
MEDIRKLKKETRKEMINLLESISPVVKKAKDKMIEDNLLDLKEYREAKNVMLFASFRNEVDTFPIIKGALKSKQNVVLPRVNSADKELELYLIRDVEELSPGYADIPEPAPDDTRAFPAKNIDLIMVPGLAFDSGGRRLGYGGGYYDRLIDRLGSKPNLVAIAYSEQIISNVPATERDKKVNIIVTDIRTIIAN